VGVGEEKDPNVVGHPYYGMGDGVCSVDASTHGTPHEAGNAASRRQT
jgi:hypothetical protein